jgi:hypothetical protein
MRIMFKFQFLPQKKHKSSLNIRAFWNIASCNLVKVDRRFRGAYCLHHQGETARRCIPEGFKVHTHRRENQKSHTSRLRYSDLLVSDI